MKIASDLSEGLSSFRVHWVCSALPSLDMTGPYDFTSRKIEQLVEDKKLGNYGLGKTESDGSFTVNWVGRSDSDLRKELKARLNPKYPKFKFSYASSAKAAFEKECKNYHDFGYG